MHKLQPVLHPPQQSPFLQKPRPDFKAKSELGKCANRTNINNVARIRIVECLIAMNGNLCGMSSIETPNLPV
jgi:hypothetical protein